MVFYSTLWWWWWPWYLLILAYRWPPADIYSLRLIRLISDWSLIRNWSTSIVEKYSVAIFVQSITVWPHSGGYCPIYYVSCNTTWKWLGRNDFVFSYSMKKPYSWYIGSTDTSLPQWNEEMTVIEGNDDIQSILFYDLMMTWNTMIRPLPEEPIVWLLLNIHYDLLLMISAVIWYYSCQWLNGVVMKYQ